jgi:alpha-galactosidase
MPKRIHSTPAFVLLNSWEPCYFDVSHDTILSLAKAAAKANIDMIVLDDGWFAKRNNDRSSLGDWTASTEKFPNGLQRLAQDVNDLGVRFGLWIEPEMVSVDSELYKKHPDWCLHHRGRSRTEGRNQLVLDLSRKNVRDYIFSTIRQLLKSANIEYVKWDMNRHHTEVYSHHWPAEQQGEISHRYICGLYEILHKLHQEFPVIVFETCSGGGGRFDPGMLFYSNQIWASDNTDATCRIPIFYGTSYAYPTCSIGSHVSTTPNHQTYRTATLKIRCLVAFCGSFGFELNPNEWTEQQFEDVRVYNQHFKDIAHVIKWGDLYRLWDPFTTPYAAWMFVSENKSEAVVFAFMLNQVVGHRTPRLRLRGLQHHVMYAIDELLPGRFRRNAVGQIVLESSDQDRTYRMLSGMTLCNAGIPLMFSTDSDCMLFRLRSAGSMLPQTGFCVGSHTTHTGDERMVKDSMFIARSPQLPTETMPNYVAL